MGGSIDMIYYFYNKKSGLIYSSNNKEPVSSAIQVTKEAFDKIVLEFNRNRITTPKHKKK